MVDSIRILGIDPGLRLNGFGSGGSQSSLNRHSRLAFTEASDPMAIVEMP